MDHFNVHAGTYGDTAEKLQILTQIEEQARYGAACLIEDGKEHLIGGSAPRILGQDKATVPAAVTPEEYRHLGI